MPIDIRSETPDDPAAIEAVTTAAFRDAEHTSHTEQFIVAALRLANLLTVSLVAEDKHEVVGHVAISPVTISDGTPGWFGLGPVSVTPGRQGEGIGATLVNRALETLRARGATGCVVLGEPSYYGRFGFRANPSLALPGVPPEYFQALAFRGVVPAGTVAYHRAFDATS